MKSCPRGREEGRRRSGHGGRDGRNRGREGRKDGSEASKPKSRELKAVNRYPCRQGVREAVRDEIILVRERAEATEGIRGTDGVIETQKEKATQSESKRDRDGDRGCHVI